MVISAVKPVPSRSSVRARLFQNLLCYTCIAILFGSTALTAKESPATLHEAWNNASLLLINDSYAIFKNISPSDHASQRQIDFGRAATLLSIQPKTAGNIAKADGLLQQLIKVDASDEVGIAAQYTSARIAQIHMIQPDEALAIQRYTELINTHPQHPLAQAAITKRALIRVFALSDEPSMESRYKTAVKDEPLLTEPGSRRDYLLLLANVSTLINQPPAVTLNHLLEAEKCNNFRKRALADIYVRIAEFSAAAGKNDLAVAYYEKFLQQFIRDNRRFIIKEKLAALKGQEIKR